MPTKIGSLYSSMTLESSSFISNAKRTATATEQMASQVDKAFGIAKVAALSFVASLSIDAILRVTKNSLEFAGGLGELAQQAGIGTTALQEYSFAATQVGVSQEEVQKGFQRLTRSIGDARNGSKTLIDAFATLGISQKDLANSSVEKVAEKFAEGLSKIPDPARRAAIEAAVLGKSGQQLDTIFAGGIAGLDQFREQARQLGVVLSEKEIADADIVADKLVALQKSFQISVAKTVSQNAGAINDLVDALAALGNISLTSIGKIGDYYRGLRELYDTSKTGIGGALSIGKALVFDDDAIALGAKVRKRRDAIATLAGTGLDGKLIGGKTTTSALDDRPDGLFTSSPEKALKEAKKTVKAVEDIYKGFSASQVRGGALDTVSGVLSQDGGVSQSFKDASDNALVLLDTVQKVSAEAAAIKPIDAITPQLLDAANQFSESLSRGLGQALVYGQSLGDALINSIKAAAAELISSQLLKLLTGGSGGGGGILGFVANGIGALFGARAAGGPVQGGRNYLVGEKGPEILRTGGPGQIISNDMLGQTANDNKRQSVDVSVDVNPSPLFAVVTRAVAQQAGQSAAAEQARRSGRQGIAKGLG